MALFSAFIENKILYDICSFLHQGKNLECIVSNRNGIILKGLIGWLVPSASVYRILVVWPEAEQHISERHEKIP